MAEINLNLELSLSQYEDDPWVLKKKLTATDFCATAQLYLPKLEMEQFILPKMENDLVRRLGDGVEVNVRDVDCIDHSYTVKLKLRRDLYFLGKGWQLIKNTKGLRKGDDIGLFWDNLKREFKFKHLKSQSIVPNRGEGGTSTQDNKGGIIAQ